MATIELQQRGKVFSVRSVSRCKQDKLGVVVSTPRWSGFEYLHRSSASRRRQRKGYRMPGGYNWANPLLRDINTATWFSRLGESRIWDYKIWPWVPRDSDPRMNVLARTRNNCKQQNSSLVREGAPHQLIRCCLTVNKSCLWPQMGAWHRVGRNITLTFLHLAELSEVKISWWMRESVERCGSWGRRQFGNPEEGDRPQLKTATEQRLRKIDKTLCVL
jgi:hypothetical protein